MSTMSKTNRAEMIRKVMAGLAKYYGKGTLLLAGTSYTPAALQKLLQSDIDANDGSTQARAAWLEAVKEARATDATTDTVLEAIEATVKGQYAKASNADTVLADFGYPAPKKVVKTVAVKAAALAKTEATRAARHTMGKRQKAKVVGILPAAATKGATTGVGTSAPNGGPEPTAK